jgi:hypothetical protein
MGEKPGAYDMTMRSPITRADAKRFVTRHMTDNNPSGTEMVYIDFPMADMTTLATNHPGINGFRVYIGKNDADKQTLIVVATKTSGTTCRKEDPEVSGLIGFDFGTLCPPDCNATCDPNSIAKEVYGTLIP